MGLGADVPEAAVRRYARRRDACEPLIIMALRRSGLAVQQNSGDGEPDLTVSSPSNMVYMECKDHYGGKATRAAHRRNDDGELPACLTPPQVKWWRAWIAAGGRPPVIVMTVADALAAVGVTLATGTSAPSP